MVRVQGGLQPGCFLCWPCGALFLLLVLFIRDDKVSPNEVLVELLLE